MQNENEFFREAAMLICRSLNVDKALTELIDYLKNHMPVEELAIGVYDPTMNVSSTLAWAGSGKIKRDLFTVSYSRQGGNIARQALLQKAPRIRIINDILKEHEDFQIIMRSAFSRDCSIISMGLELEANRHAVFVICASGKHQYTAAHGHLLSLLHDPLSIATSNIMQYREISRLRDLVADENRDLKKELKILNEGKIVGAEFGLKNTMQMVQQVAPLNSPVLILGETGVGKELVANAIHKSSSRRDKPFVKVNCGGIPESLIDSELFGHEKGAFTGALSQRYGKFERAHRGTLFLDEIGEMSMTAQVKLLRVLQQHEIERVGGNDPISVDVRIISATHRKLEEMVKSGTFREDLWFRLNVFPIIIPPLRHRSEDIPVLVSHFIDKKSKEMNIRRSPKLTPGSMDRLQAYSWPGNARELENLVERELIQSRVSGDQQLLEFPCLSVETQSPAKVRPAFPSEEIISLDEINRKYIESVLMRTSYKIEGPGGAAELLKIHPSTLRSRMIKLGIPYDKKAVSRV
ncbi:MAG: sigma 54-interacting transcriptional regulator [Desulfatitalea sp.]|nr:sigma 54-interacting transcriptional regulator [Desulfatitalea sp.]NNK00168.1 sigma 54-interacting transcriptional regulator [Desulfatitalea sp.]